MFFGARPVREIRTPVTYGSIKDLLKLIRRAGTRQNLYRSQSARQVNKVSSARSWSL